MRPRPDRAFVALLPLAAACAAPARPVAPRAAPRVEQPATEAPGSGFPSVRLAEVPGGTFGPYVGARAGAAISVWAAEREGRRRWFSAGLGGRTAPPGPRDLAEAPEEVGLAAVRPLGSAEDPGFVLLSTDTGFSGTRVSALALGSRGELLGGPATLGEALGDVVWIEAVPTPHGAVALFATREEGGGVLHAVALGASGEPLAQPAAVARGVTAWQAVDHDGGALLAYVRSGATPGAPGPVALLPVDAAGAPGAERSLHAEPTAGADLDLARVGESLVLAWTDHGGLEPSLHGAVLDAALAVKRAPGPLPLPPLGPGKLVRLVAAGGGAPGVYAAFEAALEQRPGARRTRLAALSTALELRGEVAVVDVAADDGAPAFAALPDGLALITPAPACTAGSPCEGGGAIPTFVTLDASLGVTRSAPVRLAERAGAFADLVWGPTCDGPRCFTLAASLGALVDVRVVALDAGGPPGAAPAARPASALPAPRVGSVAPLARPAPLAAVAARAVADGTLAAWVTAFDPATPFARTRAPAPDGRYEAPRAELGVAVSPRTGAAGAPRVLSYRAASAGGVALSPGDPARGESILAWTGLDERRAQAFVTRLSPGGEKLAQRMVSRTRGEASGVAIAALGATSHVVGWTETGGAEPGVHLVRLGAALETVGKPRYLGAGTSEPSLLATPGGLVAAYLEAGAPRVLRLAADLAETSPAARLSPRTAAAASPRLAPAGDGLWLAWVERPEGGAGRLAVTRLAPATEEVPGARVEVELDVAPGDCAFSGATDATRPVLLCQTRGVAPEIFEITVPATGSSRRAFLLRGSAAGPPPAAAGDALIHVGPSGVLRRVDLVR